MRLKRLRVNGQAVKVLYKACLYSDTIVDTGFMLRTSNSRAKASSIDANMTFDARCLVLVLSDLWKTPCAIRQCCDYFCMFIRTALTGSNLRQR